MTDRRNKEALRALKLAQAQMALPSLEDDFNAPAQADTPSPAIEPAKPRG